MRQCVYKFVKNHLASRNLAPIIAFYSAQRLNAAKFIKFCLPAAHKKRNFA
ncbi:hypothetical protein CAMGR0001_0010 [Campylobacter gracilis RM3268]|uniref:Uncharacterized protein n=1 Tax=Campylobacter gracilis RM3268 TaxID=553220 RepID=C8PI29_9BACT|nr:hypothetical protein CAMGR0001_0010 [Campylobacter gracilis RM3268]